MKYGKEISVEPLDTQGSTVTTESRVHDGAVQTNPIKRFEVKVKVTNDYDVHKAFLNFTDELAKNERLYSSEDTDKYDPAFRIDRPKKSTLLGFYYVWLCWSEKML